jgi:ketosteroid isomerase-like protein
MDEERLREEVSSVYAEYLSAFRAADLARIDALVRYPIAFIADGEVTLADSFPIDPVEVIVKKQVHSMVDISYEVVAVSPTKAHVVLRTAKRLRKDGSLVETISAFYAFTKTSAGWKLFAISGINIPAA